MSWGEVKKAINSDLSKPLNEQLMSYDDSRIMASDALKNTVVSTEMMSSASSASVVLGSWTAPKDGYINVKYTIKAPSFGFAAFWCSTISQSTDKQQATTRTDTLFFTGYTGSVGFTDTIPKVYTTYTTKMRVHEGVIYYFHLAGHSSNETGYINSLQILYDVGFYRLTPYFNSDQGVFLQPNVTKAAYVSSTSAQTYLGAGQLTVANVSAGALTVVVYPNAKGAGITLTLPANGNIFLPFNGTIKVQTPTSNVRVAVVYYD